MDRINIEELNKELDSNKSYLTVDVSKIIIDYISELSKELDDLKRKYKVQEAEKTLSELLKRQDAIRKQNKQLTNTRSALREANQRELEDAHYEYNEFGWF